jgi:hypothetical protein
LKQITLVTGRDMPGPDRETPLIADALRSLGVESEVAVWRDPRDWRQSSLILLRTPWDYAHHLDEFLDWTALAAKVSRLKNTADVVRWNSHKGYLLELERRGVAIVPTRLFPARPGADMRSDLLGLAQQGHWKEVVVKPAVGLSGIGSMRGGIDDPALADHLAGLLRGGDALVQPFIPSIISEGELSLVFVDSAFTHAVRKRPRRGDYRVQDNHGGTVHHHEASANEISVAGAALACAPSATIYARVDLACVDEVPVAMELEVIEPELFLRFSPTATIALAMALKAELDK